MSVGACARAGVRASNSHGIPSRMTIQRMVDPVVVRFCFVWWVHLCVVCMCVCRPHDTVITGSVTRARGKCGNPCWEPERLSPGGGLWLTSQQAKLNALVGTVGRFGVPFTPVDRLVESFDHLHTAGAQRMGREQLYSVFLCVMWRYPESVVCIIPSLPPLPLLPLL